MPALLQRPLISLGRPYSSRRIRTAISALVISHSLFACNPHEPSSYPDASWGPEKQRSIRIIDAEPAEEQHGRVSIDLSELVSRKTGRIADAGVEFSDALSRPAADATIDAEVDAAPPRPPDVCTGQPMPVFEGCESTAQMECRLQTIGMPEDQLADIQLRLGNYITGENYSWSVFAREEEAQFVYTVRTDHGVMHIDPGILTYLTIPFFDSYLEIFPFGAGIGLLSGFTYHDSLDFQGCQSYAPLFRDAEGSVWTVRMNRVARNDVGVPAAVFEFTKDGIGIGEERFVAPWEVTDIGNSCTGPFHVYVRSVSLQDGRADVALVKDVITLLEGDSLRSEAIGPWQFEPGNWNVRYIAAPIVALDGILNVVEGFDLIFDGANPVLPLCKSSALWGQR